MEPSLVVITQATLVVISLVLVVAIFRRKVLWPLTVFLLALATHMLINVVSSGYRIPMPQITPVLSFLYGPLLYLFVVHLIYVPQQFSLRTLWHFLPSLLMIPVLLFSEGRAVILPMAALLSVAIYIFLSFRQIQRFHHILQATRSNDLANLLWLRNLIGLMCLVGTFEVARVALSLLNWDFSQQLSYLMTNLTLLFFVCTLAVKAISHIEFFEGISEQDSLQIDDTDSNTGRSGYNPDIDLDRAIADIEQCLQQKSLYLQADLNLNQLAQAAGYSPREVSFAINRKKCCNFNEFINGYRIDYAKRLLTGDRYDPQSILDVMHESGFSSKAAFYHAFKKMTGMTPSQFRKTSSSDSSI